jgi:hypothetical protein
MIKPVYSEVMKELWKLSKTDKNACDKIEEQLRQQLN